MIDADKYIARLEHTLKDVKSWKNDGRGVAFTDKTKLDYLFNRCSDIVKDYHRDLDEYYGDALKEFKNNYV